MQTIVIDSSVLIAAINQEKEHESLFELLPYSVMSTVNIAEVVAILRARHKISKTEANEIIDQLVDTIVPFNDIQARISGEIEIHANEHNCDLSLADRACIALGVSMDLPIYTTDRKWLDLKFENANIKLIR